MAIADTPRVAPKLSGDARRSLVLEPAWPTDPDVRRPDDGTGADVLHMYFAAVRQVPLLTAHEERALCRRIDTAQRRLESERRSGAGAAQIERRARLARELREQLVVANLRLVIAVARRYRNAGLPLEDLVQEGNIGLMKAAERFDVDRGFRFSTYATWWIRQAITAAIGNTGRTIRLPSHVIGALRRIGTARGELVRELGRLPTPAEIATRTGLGLERVEDFLMAAEHLAPLGEPLPGGVLLGDVLADRDVPDPEARAVEAGTRRALADALATLDARERTVIELRFGLRSPKEQTLDEVGRHLGITRKRVRQLEARALRRLRLRTGRVRSRKAA